MDTPQHKTSNPQYPVILSEGHEATEVEGPAVASPDASITPNMGTWEGNDRKPAAFHNAPIQTNMGAPSKRSLGGKATNPNQPACHPERAQQVEAPAVAPRETSITPNMGAPSKRSLGGKATNPTQRAFEALRLVRKWVPLVPRFGGPGKATNPTVFLKTVQALLLALAVCFSTGATNAAIRYNDLNHRLMCTCSCAQLLGECNHVGCPASGPMLNELSAAIASGATDQQILSSFAAKYGVTVLAAPPTSGFSLVAWVAPIAVFAAALLGTILLVRHWSIGRTPAAAPATDPAITALREKIRRETETSDL